jgi:hypothetical protein
MKREVLISITGGSYEECREKIEEIKKRKITRVCFFCQHLPSEERNRLYNDIEKANIKEIPLVHIGADIIKSELEFLFSNYNSKYFTIHESDFSVLSKWKGFEKNLFLEMSSDNFVAENVKVEEIGGFCVDLAHYQKQKDRKMVDYDYVYSRRDQPELFKCNHLSGYSPEEMADLHLVSDKKDFDYLKKLPEFVFGDCIGIEINNSTEEQLEFKEYILRMI